VDNVSVEYVPDDSGIPLGFWRSVAFSQNVFYVESFMDEMADVQVHFVDSPHPPTGFDESAVPLVGPAPANAVYAATGRRVRHLTISSEDPIGDGNHR
jgi:CO/xanthine dehydrogenase Mo-binding subunit